MVLSEVPWAIKKPNTKKLHIQDIFVQFEELQGLEKR